MAPAIALITGTLFGVSCGPSDVPNGECIPVDEKIKTVPGSAYWCDGREPIELDGKLAKHSAVCRAPAEDGTCDRCPRDELEPEIVEQLRAEVEDDVMFGCGGGEIVETEVACAWSIETARDQYGKADYCCFEVAFLCG
jgi:hypothetical protein